MVGAQTASDLSRGRAKWARTLVALALAAALVGCESASDLDVFGIFDDDPPAPETAGQQSVRERGDQETAAAADQPTPNLSSVPDRPTETTPASTRERVVEGLVADRENARYSDETVRLQGESREAAAAPAAAATPRAAPSAPPATPAPTTAVPQPPQISATTGRPAGRPTSVVPPTPPPARTTPVPDPIATGPRPSVQVDATAISGGGGFPLTATRTTIDEQVATIHFSHSSSRLDDRDKQVIAQVASAQRQNDAEVVVVGHASGRTQQLDKVEHELANFRVSLARANSVAEQLIAMGVAPEKVRVEAFSSISPLYSEAMPTGEAGNRRAEIFFRQ
jgi:outer membrane protein OmpA-like peptidoglycan-associated protein